ncbi:hypothetical protein V8J88_02390 [Massilia sp. W12]|uniref:hypothetical protein n=1 Tax=Massilia sp. W12 TaxID=3126507 RepID=UPI0030D60D18
MRKDMFKVILERPRVGQSKDFKFEGRLFRNDEDAGNFLGMKAGYKWGCKVPNENLAPLERFLMSRRGQHWDRVYAEIRAQINAGASVQRHVLQHLDDLVARSTYLEQGDIMLADGRSGKPGKLADSRYQLYVHPVSRQLLENRQHRQAQKKRRQTQAEQLAQASAHICVVDEMTELHLLDGIWYRISFALLPMGADQERYDLLQRRHVSRKHDQMYRYAAHKQQVSAREMQKLTQLSKPKVGNICPICGKPRPAGQRMH